MNAILEEILLGNQRIMDERHHVVRRTTMNAILEEILLGNQRIISRVPGAIPQEVEIYRVIMDDKGHPIILIDTFDRRWVWESIVHLQPF